MIQAPLQIILEQNSELNSILNSQFRDEAIQLCVAYIYTYIHIVHIYISTTDIHTDIYSSINLLE